MDEKPSDARITSLIQIGLTALKNAVLINGGACIALLTLLGHAATSPTSKIPVAPFRFPLMLFVGGVLAAGLASGIAWLAEGHSLFALDKRSTYGIFLSLTTIGLVLLSFVFFAAGSYATYHVLGGVK